MALDFTYKKYKEIVEAIAQSEYKVYTVRDYIKTNPKPSKAIIIRHDVDLDPYYQLQFAELEHSLGIHTSYYFRHVENIFKEDLIDKVYKLGHEIGYHYEVTTKAKGDPKLALAMFANESADFREKWDAQTICPHGGSFVENVDGYDLKNIIKLIPKLISGQKVFSSWTNFSLWKDNRFEDFGLLGDAYESIDFRDILYLSDTGRSWDDKYKRLDKVESNVNPKYKIKKSDDIIEVINKGEVDKLYLLVHFEQWKNTLWSWLSWYTAQIIRRNGKKLIFSLRKHK